MHPVEHDLWGSVPSGGYVSCHLIVCVPRQTKVQDLEEMFVHPDEHLSLNEQLDYRWINTESFSHLELTVFIHSQITGLQVLRRRRKRHIILPITSWADPLSRCLNSVTHEFSGGKKNNLWSSLTLWMMSAEWMYCWREEENNYELQLNMWLHIC